MAARSAMGFAAGALRQTVARQTAPQFAPRPLAQQTRAMGASLPPPPPTPHSTRTAGTLSLARRVVAPGSSARSTPIAPRAVPPRFRLHV